MKGSPARADLERYLRAGLSAVHAGDAVGRHLESRADRIFVAGEALPEGARIHVAALGKAAVPMARALEAVAGDRVAGGLVITGDGLETPAPTRLPVRTSSHPVPDARGEAAARALLAQVAAAPEADVLIVLLSGGASALTSAPADGLALSDLAATTRALLACGADIAETNTVRKHLSVFAGGRLAAAAACHRVIVLAVSDVPGDVLDVIGSGPCMPDPSHYADALAVVDRHALRGGLPAAVIGHLEAGSRGERPESPKPGDAGFARVTHHVIAHNADARAAALRAARADGIDAIDLGEVLGGEARDAGRRLAALGHALRPNRSRLLLAGGETVVTVRGRGRGGRSQELALSAALELERLADVRVALLAAGSDGRDGPTDAAGAFASATSVARGRERGVSAERCLRDNDAYAFFEAEGGLLRTGPTRTNVMDLVLLAVGDPDSPGQGSC